MTNNNLVAGQSTSHNSEKNLIIDEAWEVINNPDAFFSKKEEEAKQWFQDKINGINRKQRDLLFHFIEKEDLDDEPMLIVLKKTGNFIEVRTGGPGFDCSRAEGFIAEKWNLELNIDECEYVCTRGKKGREKELAEAINKGLSKIHHPYFKNMSFDYDRYDELAEGWWPVKGSISEDDGVSFVEFDGYIHQGNCN